MNTYRIAYKDQAVGDDDTFDKYVSAESVSSGAHSYIFSVGYEIVALVPVVDVLPVEKVVVEKESEDE